MKKKEQPLIIKEKDLGERGEYLARLYLEQKGFLFFRANYAARSGEIDLIMKDGGELVFVEVKTRTLASARQFGRGADKIDASKQEKIFKTASLFMRTETKLSEGLIARFDSVELFLDEEDEKKVHVVHTPCAFGLM